MRQIDQQFLKTPFFGVRQMTWHLRSPRGRAAVGPRKPAGWTLREREADKRLLRLMGLMPIYLKPNTSRPEKGRKTYP
ncbi:hypothetical protein B6V75_18165 [Thioclava sp. F1Mire-8]|nr:hypothetical protein B6V75_18165 [Thioclava sp. F1Mire-8]